MEDLFSVWSKKNILTKLVFSENDRSLLYLLIKCVVPENIDSIPPSQKRFFSKTAPIPLEIPIKLDTLL